MSMLRLLLLHLQGSHRLHDIHQRLDPASELQGFVDDEAVEATTDSDSDSSSSEPFIHEGIDDDLSCENSDSSILCLFVIGF